VPLPQRQPEVFFYSFSLSFSKYYTPQLAAVILENPLLKAFAQRELEGFCFIKFVIVEWLRITKR
jgi:hypothetical protein